MYDLDKLQEELKNLDNDIIQIDQIRAERVKKREDCLELIAGCKAILKLHGEDYDGQN